MKNDALRFIAPELVREGLLKNEHWVQSTADRAARLCANDRTVQSATLLAVLDEPAIDYLEQAPVLILAATHGARISLRKERLFTCMTFGSLVERRPRLRDMLAEYRIAYPMRTLSGKALEPSSWPVVQALSAGLDSSTLAQAIPADPRRHLTWLRALSTLWGHLTRRSGAEGPDKRILPWAALALSRHEPWVSFANITEVIDFIVCNLDRFNVRWTWARVLDESARWHAEMREAQMDMRNGERLGAEYDKVISYGDLPLDVVRDDFQFVALQTLRALTLEGMAMHHCVASYYQDVCGGRARIYSVRKAGKRVATAELIRVSSGGDGWVCVQLKASCNRRPAVDVRRAVARFVNSIGQAIA